MVQLNIQGGFNAAGVVPNAARPVIPSGIYDAMMTASREVPTKDSMPTNPKSFYEFEYTIQGGEFAGTKLYDRLNINNPNQTAVNIAYGTLSAICHVTGVMHINDTQQLHNRPLKLVVSKEPRNDQTDRKPEERDQTNRITAYKDINGNDPGKSGQVANAGAQPGWATQQQQPTPGQYAPGNGYAPPGTAPSSGQGNTQGNTSQTWNNGQTAPTNVSPSNAAPPQNQWNSGGAPQGQQMNTGAPNPAPGTGGGNAPAAGGAMPPWAQGQPAG